MLLVLATEEARLPWWDHLAEWTYSSCHAFLDYISSPIGDHTGGLEHGDGHADWWQAASSADSALRRHYQSSGDPASSPPLMLRLGSCLGGWDCTNPSHHAPAHYRAFRDFMSTFAPRLREQAPRAVASVHAGEAARPRWQALIGTSYRLLADAQCAATGLVPTRFEPGPHTVHCLHHAPSLGAHPLLTLCAVCGAGGYTYYHIWQVRARVRGQPDGRRAQRRGRRGPRLRRRVLLHRACGLAPAGR